MCLYGVGVYMVGIGVLYGVGVLYVVGVYMV